MEVVVHETENFKFKCSEEKFGRRNKKHNQKDASQFGTHATLKTHKSLSLLNKKTERKCLTACFLTAEMDILLATQALE